MHSFLTDKQINTSLQSPFVLSDHPCDYKGDLQSDKKAKKRLKAANRKIADLQRKLYATDHHSVLLVFQAMDAAGKDSTIRSVFSGVNPTGFQVSSFKAPSKKELDHDYLWRCQIALPERGRIGIFNRSHYEEVLVCKVHPEYVLGQNIPGVDSLEKLNAEFWEGRYRQIHDWERHLSDNGTMILKFFLNVSRDEQKRRFQSRIDDQRKNWKFSLGDVHERQLWDKYMQAYESAINATSTAASPWLVIPADNKAIMRAMVAEIVAERLESLDLSYPKMNQKAMAEMKEGQEILEKEG